MPEFRDGPFLVGENFFQIDICIEKKRLQKFKEVDTVRDGSFF